MELNYSQYLRIDDLLKLQHPQSDPAEHDEMLFIIIHQVYELWFKQLLHEIDRLKQLLNDGQLFRSISAFRRMRMVMKTLVGQLDVLETMTPLSFSAFRDRLDSASGFQSTQFREFEFVLGFKRPEALKHVDPSWPGTAKVLQRFEESTLIDAFYRFLKSRDIDVPDALLERDVKAAHEPNEVVQQGILRLYRTQPEVAILFELMTDFDEGLQEWRYRHVKIVERTIGNKKGTGGSLGVEFLKRSLFIPIFTDIWAIRHEF